MIRQTTKFFCLNLKDMVSEERYWLGDNSSQATIRPRRQFVPNSKKRQFVPSVNSSHFEKATIRPICKKRQFVPNCLIDQLITNLLKVETKIQCRTLKICKTTFKIPELVIPQQTAARISLVIKIGSLRSSIIILSTSPVA